MYKNKKVGLSLSGGGYRAAAFHLGTLRKLSQLGIIEHVDVISTISGGSIAGAYYVLNKADFTTFEAGLIKCLTRSVIRKIIFSWRMLWLIIGIVLFFFLLHYLGTERYEFLIMLLGGFVLLTLFFFFQFFFFPFTLLKIKAYKKIFFGEKTLNDFPDNPEIAINATNLETGTLWTFSKRKASDSSYEYPKDGGARISFKSGEFPIAMAVASSTCVPVPFSPVKIAKSYYLNETDFKRIRPSLSDGGLYDNQGIHKITQPNSSYSCDIIICSDGSQPFNFRFKGTNSFSVLYRANDIMMRKIKSLQFIRDVYSKKNEIAYFSLDWDYETCIKNFVRSIEEEKVIETTINFHGFTELYLKDIKKYRKILIEEVKAKIDFVKIIEEKLTAEEVGEISRIPTGLSAFTEKKINLLSRHAEILTEIQIKLYCPTLIN